MKKNKKKVSLFLVISILIPIILTAISILTTTALSEKKKSISLEVHTNKHLFPVEKRIETRLKEIDLEKFLDKLNFMTFRIVNDGKKGIIGKTDLAKNIEIIFPEGYRIIGKPEIVKNLNEVEIKFDDKCKENEIKFWFDLLNSEQSFTIDIFYIGGPPVNPELKAKILDIDKVYVRNTMRTSEEKSMILFGNFVSATFYSMILIFMIFFLGIYISLSKVDKTKIFLIILMVSYMIFNLIFVIRNYYRIIKLLNIPSSNLLLLGILISFFLLSCIYFILKIVNKRFKNPPQLKSGKK